MSKNIAAPREDQWKSAARTVAIGVFMALLGMFLTKSTSSVSRAEVSDMIQKESPYIKDQALILANVKTTEKTLEEIQAIRKELEAIKIQQAEIKSLIVRK